MQFSMCRIPICIPYTGIWNTVDSTALQYAVPLTSSCMCVYGGSHEAQCGGVQ